MSHRPVKRRIYVGDLPLMIPTLQSRQRIVTRQRSSTPAIWFRRSGLLTVLALSGIALVLITTTWGRLAAKDGSSHSKTPTTVASVRFTHHILDSDLFSLGADVGDADSHGVKDIIACDAQGIYWYAQAEKHLIDHFTEPTLFIHLR